MRYYWRDAARAVKRAVISSGQRRLAGQSYRVAYESRYYVGEPDYPVLQQLSRGKSCVFDVGAYMGFASLIMSSVLHPSGKICAFEASEEACRILRENLMLNRLEQRVEIVNAIVAERSGVVMDFYRQLRQSSFPTSAATIVSSRGFRNAIKKVTTNLDDFASQTGSQPELVVIDVEGAEGKVLAGMQRLLKEARPLIEVELHDVPGMTIAQSVGAILPLMRGFGYQTFGLHTDQAVSLPEIWAGLAWTNVLLIPEGYPISAGELESLRRLYRGKDR